MKNFRALLSRTSSTEVPSAATAAAPSSGRPQHSPPRSQLDSPLRRTQDCFPPPEQDRNLQSSPTGEEQSKPDMETAPAASTAAPSAAGGSTELPEKAVERSGSDAKGLKAPSSFFCPISMDLMADPVMVATGHTYDRSCIERWLAQGHRTCPATGVRLRHLELTPNFALRSAIQDWASENSVTLPNVNNPTQRTTTSSYRWEEDPNSRHILQGHDEIVWAVEVSDRRLFSASADKTIRVWDITSRRCEQVLEDHTRPVLSLAVAGRRLFSGSYDFTIKVWDLDSLERVKTLEGHKDAVRALEVCNNLLFSGSYDGTVKVWDIESLREVKTLEGHTGPVRTLVYSAGRMFSGSYDKTVRVWDVDTLQCLATLQGHSGAVRALAASENCVFSGSDDTTIKVWDSRSLTCLKTLQGHEDNVRVLCVGAGFLFSGSWDKTIRVWDLGQGFIQHRVLEGHLEAVLALAVGDNCLVSGSYDTTVRFWDLSTLRCVRKCDGHDDAVRVLAAADGLVFSGSYDGSIGVW
eukprot:CAMPEP_0177764970 /NCGR_PEP_ID=MMETSP0491_2-20121128/7731_1 /TAXON_ID=63592 /ORGANISM="Tetraselmis chuii, Strain PLY429" /LENGTH=521 /DNA_ID=CAMNT_0019281265 /DNA_START=443 /DNA_END=2008 /DNA_ORIENTATION=+